MAKTATDEDFTILKSDETLREKVTALTCENPLDRLSLDRILKQTGLSRGQRDWMNAILKRKGVQYKDEIHKPKVVTKD